ncbi:MAG: hypothetical protein R2811_00170 [Flavobacteriales bacterium]
MKPVNLNALPYKLRYNGASLLIAKANRLHDLNTAKGAKGEPKALRSALAYYDMALVLMKPYDPNYCTILNWKCNVLRDLGQFEDAVSWYREIIRISDETDGKNMRDATALVAEQMIGAYTGRPNEPLPAGDSGADDFDDPPYCMYAEEFCALLAERKFSKAHARLAPALKERVTLERLKSEWKRLTNGASSTDLDIVLEKHILDRPTRKGEEIGWCYLSVSTETINEAISVVVGRTPYHGYWITELEIGRP